VTLAAGRSLGDAATAAGFAQAIGDCSDARGRSLGDIVDTPSDIANKRE
jgi:hypothetical protein